MADKMMRVAGRGDDGTAKALKVDNDGQLNVSLVGTSETITLYENKPIAAGQAFGYAIDNFKGSRIAIYVSLSSRAAVVVELDNRPSTGSIRVGSVQNLHTGSDRNRVTAQTDLVSERMLIRFTNNSAEDTTIVNAIATLFY